MNSFSPPLFFFKHFYTQHPIPRGKSKTITLSFHFIPHPHPKLRLQGEQWKKKTNYVEIFNAQEKKYEKTNKKKISKERNNDKQKSAV